jgi:serine/threonine-protein kinase
MSRAQEGLAGRETGAGRREDEAEIFEAAVALEPERRSRFLDSACGSERELRRRVERLLALDASEATFLSTPHLDLGSWTTDTAVDPLSGRLLGPYRVLRRLARGGMSLVYLAERADDEFRKQVAVKVMWHPLARADLWRRFRNERQILAELEHPSIVRLLDGGTISEGLPYVVMELIEGRPITVHCDAQRMSVEERLALFIGVCDAVHYAHRNLVVHRDLKPSNILVTAAGEPRLLDFGIAKLLAPRAGHDEAERTATAERAFSLGYASPEQAAGRPVTTASDVYSLGVVLYELLCGRLPQAFAPGPGWEASGWRDPAPPSRALSAPAAAEALTGEGGPGIEELAAARSATPAGLRRRLRGDLDRIALKALQVDPEARYGSVDQLARDVGAALAYLPVSATPPSLRDRLAKLVRRHRVAVATSATLALLMIAALVFALVQSVDLAHERDRARAEAERAAQERQRAESVTRFLIDTFETADPFRSESGPEETVRQMLKRRAAEIEALDDAEAQAALRLTIGHVYERLGLYSEAESFVRGALDQSRRLVGDSSRGAADGRQVLARVMMGKGELKAARELAAQALAYWESTPRGAEWAEAQVLLAGIEREHGDHESAEKRLRRALEQYRATPGDRRAEIAEAAHGLAKVLVAQGRYRESLGYSREAVTLLTARFGPDHQSIYASLGTVAVGLLYGGELAEAEALYRTSLDRARALFGPQHPEVAIALTNLGFVLDRRQKYEEAEAAYRKALSIYEATGADRHPGMTDTLNNLAILYQSTGRVALAVATFERCLDETRKLVGDRHRAVATTLHNLGKAHSASGDLRRAREALRAAGDMIRELLGNEHPDLAVALASLGATETALGEHGAAESAFLESLAIDRAALGPDNLALGSHTLGYAELMVAAARFAEAEALARETLRIYESALPADHWLRARAETVLGTSLAGLGHAAEAEALLLAGLAGLELGQPHDPATGRAYLYLAEGYERAGQADRAEHYRARLRAWEGGRVR